MAAEHWRGVQGDLKKGAGWKAIVRWYFLGSLIAATRIWKESSGIRFILPLSAAFGGLAWILYEALKRATAS
jgi:sirohydrochlorin ferrochelatase